ncbi:MAG TPA: DUF222 domain-containing protein [Longimicrobiales bacterium]|nr:DUF222 domain-containing protein [Longimicrobiales bacterium]
MSRNIDEGAAAMGEWMDGAASCAPEEGDAPAEVDPDLVEDIGDEIVTLAAHHHATSHRLMMLLLRFDALRGWEAGGHRSCAHWFAFAAGYDLGTAREYMRVARALEALPRTSAIMARGELSFSQTRALTRVADASSEDGLLELARGVPTAKLEKMVRAWKKGSRQDEAERERELHDARTLSVFPDDDGMYIVRGRLTPEVGAMLMRAIEAAGGALFREKQIPGEDTARAAARLRADAVGLLAERALAAGFGAGSCACQEGPEECGCPVREAPLSGTRAERFLVTLHADQATLTSAGDPAASPLRSHLEDGTRVSSETSAREPGRSHLEDGTRVSPETWAREPGRSHLEDGTRVSSETSRRLACDASVVRVTRGPDGAVLDVGRKTRSISPALRRALEVRDGGCRFPGCNARFTDGHHVTHWADGGATSLANCLLLCRFHHRLVHEGGWRVEWWGEGRPAFVDARGQAHFDGGWKPPKLGERPVEELVRGNRARGVDPDPWKIGPRWKREQDIPDAVLLGAMEAVG